MIKELFITIQSRAKKLKSDIPALFLALKDEDTPVAAKILAAVTVAYALSPIDLIPDFIPVLGYLDDLLILPALAALTIKLTPKEKLEQYRTESEGMWENGKPKRWYYVVPIILFWLIIIVIVIRCLI